MHDYLLFLFNLKQNYKKAKKKTVSNEKKEMLMSSRWLLSSIRMKKTHWQAVHKKNHADFSHLKWNFSHNSLGTSITNDNFPCSLHLGFISAKQRNCVNLIWHLIQFKCRIFTLKLDNFFLFFVSPLRINYVGFHSEFGLIVVMPI